MQVIDFHALGTIGTLLDSNNTDGCGCSRRHLSRGVTMRTNKMIVVSGLALSIVGAAGLIASLPAAAQTQPGAAPSMAPAKATNDDAAEFAKLDKNKDGFIDKTEAVVEPRLLTNFDAADTN